MNLGKVPPRRVGISVTKTTPCISRWRRPESRPDASVAQLIRGPDSVLVVSTSLRRRRFMPGRLVGAVRTARSLLIGTMPDRPVLDERGTRPECRRRGSRIRFESARFVTSQRYCAGRGRSEIGSVDFQERPGVMGHAKALFLLVGRVPRGMCGHVRCSPTSGVGCFCWAC